MHPSAQTPSAGTLVPHTPMLFICMAASSLLMIGLVAALVLL